MILIIIIITIKYGDNRNLNFALNFAAFLRVDVIILIIDFALNFMKTVFVFKV